MLRRIIQIDEGRCNGCGLCAKACHEKAIAIINSKAKLIKDDYCDGLGDCLPACPQNAISFVVREANEYDEQATKKHIMLVNEKLTINWPIQLKLAPIKSEMFSNKKLVIAADCAGFCVNNFVSKYAKDGALVIACPKLDNTDYSEKLEEIIRNNSITSVLVVKMEVPCCGRLEAFASKALTASEKPINMECITISKAGKEL